MSIIVTRVSVFVPTVAGVRDGATLGRIVLPLRRELSATDHTCAGLLARRARRGGASFISTTVLSTSHHILRVRSYHLRALAATVRSSVRNVICFIRSSMKHTELCHAMFVLLTGS